MPQAEDLVTRIEELLPSFLPHQRWFGSSETPDSVNVVHWDVRREEPLLVWLVAEVHLPGEELPAVYQLVLAGRPADVEEKFLKGKERVTVGEVEGLVIYDALVDPELALDVLAVVAPDEEARVARPLLVEQSNTSVVYDERLILKLFRHLHPEPNPDVEINRVLGEQGFPHVVPQRAELRQDGRDLAVVRDYLLGATDAWKLALTSLRDLLGSRLSPEDAGGDFASDAVTLGSVTASLHVALADAFGVSPAEPRAWLDDMRTQLERTPTTGYDLDRGRVAAALEARIHAAETSSGTGSDGDQAPDAGVAIRIHGDLHLGQFLLCDAGWFVLDFEGEPARPMAERLRPSSPLRDVAGMLRSFHYASRAVLVERGRDIDPGLAKLAEAWEARATDAFWRGYMSVPEVERLLPADEISRQALTSAFELDKAVYELGYEAAHRPAWVGIPASAIERLLAT